MVTRAMRLQIAADDAEVEKVRERFGNEEAAKLESQLYMARRTAENSSGSGFGQFPRGFVILIALWVGVLETADKLPKLLLTYPQYEATLAEYQAKMMQPELTAAQLEKAKQDAKASQFQPELAATQLEKNKFDTQTAAVQPDIASNQLTKTRFEAQAAAAQPVLAYVQLDKAKLDTKAAAFQPALLAAQAFKAEVDATASGSTMEAGSAVRLHNMFDLIDPNHPSLISRGLSEPNVAPLVPFLKKDVAKP